MSPPMRRLSLARTRRRLWHSKRGPAQTNVQGASTGATLK